MIFSNHRLFQNRLILYIYTPLDKLTFTGEGNCLHAILQTKNGDWWLGGTNGLIWQGIDIRELVDGAFGGNLSNRDYLNTEGAVRIKTNGIVDNVIPKNNSDFSLEEMYALINTDIVETVYLPGNKIMIVDEEGALRTDRNVNWMATKIVTDIALKIGRMPTFIFGDVMIINQSQIK